MKEITLGLDIGTQYCYAGYMDWNQETKEWDFKQAILSDREAEWSIDSDETLNNGIPTMFAYDTTSPNDEPKYLFGVEAERMISSLTSNWITDSRSLKTRIREQLEYGAPDTYFYLSSGALRTRHSLWELFQGFVKYIAQDVSTCLNSRFTEWKISKVIFAYPNLQDSGADSYKDKLKECIAEAFTFPSRSKPEVEAKCEAQIVASCLAKKLSSERKPDFCTIDVGGGTTDIAVMKWEQTNEKNKKGEYLQKSAATSEPFGGKVIDVLLQEGNYSDPNISAQGILEDKIWIFTGKGEPRSGIVGVPNTIRTIITDQATRHSAWRALTRRLEQYKGLINSQTTIVLLGGSSALPFVQEKIKEMFNTTEGQVVSLNEWARKVRIKGITTANCIAYAAANFELPGSNEVTMSPEYTVALKRRDGSYCILADGTMPHNDETYYYHLSGPWRDRLSDGCLADCFNPTLGMYKLDLKKDLGGKTEIDPDEIEEYFDETNDRVPYSGYVGRKQILPQSERLGYYYGTAFKHNFSELSGGGLHIYLFDNCTYRPYYDESKQIEIDYQTFQNQVRRSKLGLVCMDPNKSPSEVTTNISPVQTPQQAPKPQPTHVSTPQQSPKSQQAPSQPAQEPFASNQNQEANKKDLEDAKARVAKLEKEKKDNARKNMIVFGVLCILAVVMLVVGFILLGQEIEAAPAVLGVSGVFFVVFLFLRFYHANIFKKLGK